jgi:ubiquinol-cytochrome c reductase cytochrome c1 subunit
MKTKFARLAAALAFALPLGAAAYAADSASSGGIPEYPLMQPRHVQWSFTGPFGKYDPQQLQRGFQIYKEVCSNCHSLSMVAFRTLASTTGPHFTDEEAKAIAAGYSIADPTVESGERPGRPSDVFPPAPPFPGGNPPDLSLIAKARAVERGFPTFIFDFFTQYEQAAGPDYIYSLLTGFQDAPAGFKVPDGSYYNPYFISGPTLAMPPPLTDGLVNYAQNKDDNPNNDVPETVDQYAKDVAAFLMWAAEPHLVERKATGLTVMVFLVIFASLLYYTKKKVWEDVSH